MPKEKSILFAIDSSDFSKQALIKTGKLLKPNEDFKIILFHGTADPCAILPPELLGEDSGSIESPQVIWNLEARKVLDNAREALIASGFNPERISTVFEEKCNDPAASMLKTADKQPVETLALGRWGKSSVSRQIIGANTYHLAQLANNIPLWVIDPRIYSYNVLVGLVGAPISQRVVDYTVKYFSHLKDSTFTLFHVIPPLPPQGLDSVDIVNIEGNEHQQKIIWEKIVFHFKDYTDKVKEIANDARDKLIKAGIPEKNVFLKIQSQKRGIARDILVELEDGNHGILVIGRRGFKDIRDFGLGSKANKLLIKARVFSLCLVN
ncbi:MAG: universal stress protein [Desulfobacterales bacterium]